jgi:uncharacterized protein YkwD
VPYVVAAGPPPAPGEPSPWRPSSTGGAQAAAALSGKHLVIAGLAGVLLLAGVLIPGSRDAAPATVDSATASRRIVWQETEPTPEESRRIGWHAAEQGEALARDVFHRVNDERMARGIRPLVWDEDLAHLARGWSTQMIQGSFEHSPESYRAHPRFPWGLGENIAMGQEHSQEVHVGWMQSDGHRYNILEPSYGAIGVGIVCRKDGRMWATQLFAPSPDPRHRAAAPQHLNLEPEPLVRQDPGVRCPS